MELTGIKTPLGMKIQGPTLEDTLFMIDTTADEFFSRDRQTDELISVLDLTSQGRFFNCLCARASELRYRAGIDMLRLVLGGAAAVE